MLRALGEYVLEGVHHNLAFHRWLAAHPEFVREDAAAFVPRAVVNDAGEVETFPHRHHVDGSFAVRFRKQTAPIA